MTAIKQKRTWANEAAVCAGCHRPFRLTEEAIADQLAENGGNEATRADAVQAIQFCLGCVDGQSPAGEYDVIAYYGWAWSSEHKRWLIVFAWKNGPRGTWPTVRSQQRTSLSPWGKADRKRCMDWVETQNRAIADAMKEETPCAR